jgi:hypothetical protein
MHLTAHVLMHPPISNTFIAFVSNREAVTKGCTHVPELELDSARSDTKHGPCIHCRCCLCAGPKPKPTRAVSGSGRDAARLADLTTSWQVRDFHMLEVRSCACACERTTAPLAASPAHLSLGWKTSFLHVKRELIHCQLSKKKRGNCCLRFVKKTSCFSGD